MNAIFARMLPLIVRRVYHGTNNSGGGEDQSSSELAVRESLHEPQNRDMKRKLNKPSS